MVFSEEEGNVNAKGEGTMPRIAVVDDDVDFLGYMNHALSDEGWSVLTCSDSLRALAMLRQELPDVVILDVRMASSHSGWEMCAFLQMHPATQHIPIIICSADTAAIRERETWIAKRGLSVLHKPFDLDDLYDLVRHALDRPVPAHIEVRASAG
jgi:CheY-like chemotaxis protein